VEGSDFEPYRVLITRDENGDWEADCTCPYEWGGWCKHIVATALAYLRDPKTIEEHPRLDVLLASMEAEELRALICTLAERNLDWTIEIEAEIARRQRI